MTASPQRDWDVNGETQCGRVWNPAHWAMKRSELSTRAATCTDLKKLELMKDASCKRRDVMLLCVYEVSRKGKIWRPKACPWWSETQGGRED